MREKIINIFVENIFTAPKIIRTTPELMGWVIENSLLDKPSEHSLVENAYSATTGETNICEFGKIKRFKSYNKGYLNCGGQCQCAVKKMKATNLERYGTECSVQSPDIKDQVKQTMLEKYGVENSFQATEVKEKIKETNREKYGVDHPSQLQSTIEKMKATNLERYGFQHPLQSPDIKEQVKQTMLKRYGVEHNWQSPEIREAAKETMLELYGVDHPMKSENIKHQAKQTSLEKYGTTHHTQRYISSDALNTLNDHDKLKELFTEHNFESVANLFSVDPATIGRYAKKHGLESPNIRSQPEIEIAQFLDSLGIKYERNTRQVISPQELDFYLPDYNLAIEFNGLYWHSDVFKHKHYHADKTKACMNMGIQLIHIFEDEWKHSEQTIKRKIQHLCGMTHANDHKTIGARKLTISEVDKGKVSDFINQNHIQKMPPGASHYIAVNHNDKLVAAVLLKKISDGVVDMTRFCTDQQGTYAGLMSKVVSFIKKNYGYHLLITFADLRYSTGDVYIKSGFTEIGRIDPDYFYFDGVTRHHKFNFRKNKMSTLFGVTSENKTEAMMAKEVGLMRIYDSGKIKYGIELSKAGESPAR